MHFNSRKSYVKKVDFLEKNVILERVRTFVTQTVL